MIMKASSLCTVLWPLWMKNKVEKLELIMLQKVDYLTLIHIIDGHLVLYLFVNVMLCYDLKNHEIKYIDIFLISIISSECIILLSFVILEGGKNNGIRMTALLNTELDRLQGSVLGRTAVVLFYLCFQDTLL